ncbi:MAG: thiamine pyrophosphate-dependent enzyme, partial [Candidatus Eiseniibacteriota bacterium]
IEGEHFRVPMGRPIPFATGMAAASPEREILVLLGDGEAAGIGGNHLIHAARRGDRVRVLIVNNEVLGGTGGFPSPTTPQGARTALHATGSAPKALDVADVVRAARAAWVGRETITAGPTLGALLDEFLAAPPFALLEVRAPCFPAYGRWNGHATPEAMRDAMELRALRGEVRGGARPVPGAPDPASGSFRVGRLWPASGGRS